MDPTVYAFLAIGVMFILILLHVPIGIAMAVIGISGFGMICGFLPAFSLLATETSSAISNVNLAVIPLFLLMGNFATASGISTNIYDLAYGFSGHRRGGLALATILGCGFFGAICGSSPATAATFGRVAFPEMRRRNYAPSFAAGCIAAGGTLGSMVPPSIIMIIYAVMAEEMIFAIFLAAVVPAILQILFAIITIQIWVRIKPDAAAAGPRMSRSELIKVIRASWSGLTIAVTVIGGIYGGIFTVNEAAAFGAALSFIFSIIRNNFTGKIFWQGLIATANTTAMIYIIIIGANILSCFITLTHMPQSIISIISEHAINDVLILVSLLVVYLVLGSIFDTLAAMLITLPVVLPLIISMGYSPIWWGIINVVIIEIGMITPPIGLNVFVLHGVTGVPLSTIYRGTFPFIIAEIIRLTLLVIFPFLVTWLPMVLT
jgi:C4-dicarboxylate transporter, DctM subunit